MTTHALPANRTTTGVATSWVVVTGRALRRYVRTPQLVVVGTVQMALFMLVYRYMLGGAINTGRIDYVDYLVPGFVTSGVLWIAGIVAVFAPLAIAKYRRG
jgi:ABC-2 type transport system permease protein